ncbi:chloramphenicol acetyltransferase [Mucilaginibacter sp.]|uniref:chloramphenicol acetyltransferase n=1 Tax=Mucilaginibacter sp. TaxID=1882438 RepID=UPI00260160FA|nr:chloramphenicol acetyltransferase [Mucilaginibacter sp.]MDB4918851.1 chloramphenicol acetyltransferase [Mucilaginibacter sp.]
MKTKFDTSTWARKAHFEFFSKFEDPVYGVCVDIDCTTAYKFAKEKGVSFYLYMLYKSLAAANTIEPFKLRIDGDEAFIYERVDAASTIGRANGTFGFGYIDYNPSFAEFITAAKIEVERVQSRNDLEPASRQNIIRFSSLPWIDFTSLSHARMFAVDKDSSPNISFGKMTEKYGKRSMPMSVHVHHALVDGLHIGQYIDCFQELMKGV